MFWLGIVPGPLQWEASTLEESHLNSLLTAIRNIYIWTRDGINYLPISDWTVRKNAFTQFAKMRLLEDSPIVQELFPNKT
jgi:hypothetical protein